MTTNEELASKDALILHLERQNRMLKETLLDHLAQAALASGRAGPSECYNWAQAALQEREKYV